MSDLSIEKTNSVPMPSIDITPKMKQSVLYEGQPLFYSGTNHVPGSKKPYQIKVGNITYGSSVDNQVSTRLIRLGVNLR